MATANLVLERMSPLFDPAECSFSCGKVLSNWVEQPGFKDENQEKKLSHDPFEEIKYETTYRQ